MSIDPLQDEGILSQRRFSDGTLMVERENEYMQITHDDEVMHEHITVPKDDPEAAHWSAFEVGEGKLSKEPLDQE